MQDQHLSGAAIGGLEKNARSNFWWPRTDSVESARRAAKGGSVAFGLIALGQLPNLVAIFVGHRTTADDYLYDGSSLLIIALPVYLAWRTYKRPTVLLNCIAFVFMALALGLDVLVVLASNGVTVAPLLMPILATVAAVGGIRGSIALRRFKASAPPTGASTGS